MYLVQTSRHRSQEFNWTSECSSFASPREDARGLGTNSSLERQSVVRLQLTPTSRYSNVLMQVRAHLASLRAQFQSASSKWTTALRWGYPKESCALSSRPRATGERFP